MKKGSRKTPLPRRARKASKAKAKQMVLPRSEPALPPGAVRGNPLHQHFCPMCHGPRHYYVDQPRVCVACGSAFVFSGQEQKFWFEELHFHFDSVPIRCLSCRKRHRTAVSLERAVARAREQESEVPERSRGLALAEALVRLHEHTGYGDLAEAIARARRVLRREDARPGERGEATFWEAKAHALAGRTERAHACFETALSTLAPNARGASLRAEARWWLARTAEPTPTPSS